MIQLDRNAVTQPTNAATRLDALDIVRGLALFGILFVNLTWFTGFAVLWGSGQADFNTLKLDGVVYWWIYLLVDAKFWSIFAILFGVGIGLYFEKTQSKGPGNVLWRRFSVLFVVGLLHGILLWFGDIIALYAATGFFVLLFRNCSNRCLLISAIILLALPLLHSAIWLWIKYSFVMPDAKVETPPHGPYDQLHYFETGSLWDVIRTNWPFFIQRWLLAVYEGRFFKLLGLFLIGVYLVRQRWFDSNKTRSGQMIKVFLVTLLPGLVLNYFMANWETYGTKPPGAPGLWLSYAIETIGVPLLATAYLSSFLIAAPLISDTWFGLGLAAVGRMSLTNYISQTVICMILFYGCGFGLWGAFGLSWTLLVILGIVVVQGIFSALWLRKFQFGPLEWIGRMATYGRWLPLTRREQSS